MKIIYPLYNFYSLKIIPFIGEKIANNKAAYKYSNRLHKRIPHNQELENIFTKNGFFCYNRIKYFGGIAYLNVFSKI